MKTEKILILDMAGEEEEINKFCEEIGSLSNNFNIEVKFY